MGGGEVITPQQEAGISAPLSWNLEQESLANGVPVSQFTPDQADQALGETFNANGTPTGKLSTPDPSYFQDQRDAYFNNTKSQLDSQYSTAQNALTTYLRGTGYYGDVNATPQYKNMSDQYNSEIDLLNQQANQQAINSQKQYTNAGQNYVNSAETDAGGTNPNSALTTWGSTEATPQQVVTGLTSFGGSTPTLGNIFNPSQYTQNSGTGNAATTGGGITGGGAGTNVYSQNNSVAVR